MSLFRGSAAYYLAGRLPYPPGLGAAIRREVPLHATQRLLDVGCGPGSLTRLVAPFVAQAVGIDADPEMIAAAPPIANVQWRQMRAEDLPGDLGPFDVVTFAQSFHWMEQRAVARTVRQMLTEDGTLVFVSASTHRGDDSQDPLPHPRPPHDEIARLIESYVGPPPREGTPWEDDLLRASGFRGPRRVDLDSAQVVTRTADEIVAVTFSLSYGAPHRFGDRLAAFERDLRALLGPGPFAERTRAARLDIWR